MKAFYILFLIPFALSAAINNCGQITSEASCNSSALSCHWDAAGFPKPCLDGAPTNARPIANAGTDQSVNVGADVTLDGSASTDNDGTISSYAWDDGNGNTATGVTPTISGLVAGSYTFTLTITDNDGDTDSDTVLIKVNTVSSSIPSANAGANQTATSGDSVTLDGSGSTDSDGTIVTYSWTDGATTWTGDTPTVDTTGWSDGDHTITLTVTDNDGNTDTDTLTLTINSTTPSTPTQPEDQNEYSCGIFPSVLTSYTKIDVQQNDVYNTCAISVKDSVITESAQHSITCYNGPEASNPSTCSCDPTTQECSLNQTCELIPEPTNTYSHTFIDSNISDTNVVTLNAGENVSGLNHPSYIIPGDATFTPDVQYANTTRNVLLAGNIIRTNTNHNLTLNEGDYYFESFYMDGQNNDLFINGDVRIYVDGDFTVEKKLNIVFNETASLFIYVDGDLTFEGGGGGSYDANAFFYVTGNAIIYNSAASTKFLGGITAEGSLEIDPSNSTSNAVFEYDEAAAANIGFGECQLCYAAKDESGFGFGPVSFLSDLKIPIHNTSDETLSNVQVFETYSDTSTFSVFSTKNVVDQDDNVVGTADAITTSSYDFANIAQVSLKSSGNIYNIGDNYTPNPYPSDTYKAAHSSTFFSFNSDFNSWKDSVYYFASYTDENGNSYPEMQLEICEDIPSTVLNYSTGPFDAWDTSVADVTPPALSSRIIKTKIVESPFQLSLASFNEDLSDYELKDEPLAVSIYEKNTTNIISNTVTFNSAHADHTFTVTEARRDAVVGFKMCASYFDATDDGVDNKIYALTSSSDCSGATQACDSVSENPTWRVCHSTDNFAIRPKNFSITSAASKIISAQNQAYSIQANNYLNLPTIGYNVSATDYAMDTSDTKYLPDDSIDATLMGTSTISDFSFNDGLSSDMNLSYSDIGKVGISMQDRTWAVVDITDTPQTCNADGAYVCGDTNATFIPKRFNLNNVHLNNSNSGTHTYISDDLNMSAQMSLIITAVNENNAITQNFTSASWEEPVSLDITIASAAITPTLIKNVIATNKLGFNAGALTLAMTETNSSKKLLFNYSRAKNIALNPFRIDGTEVTTSALASYVSGETVTGSSVADQNATFVYGRTHAPRQRFTGPNGTALIYYEISCDETISVNACDKTLLPNGMDSKTSDDPRWFINPSHLVTTGVVGTVTQKGTSALVTATAPTGTNIANVALTYDFTSKGYPYKATMENNASSWLIYNPYDINDDDNDFEVEFTNSDNSWAGQKETDTVTNRNASDKTNRRSMW